MPQKQSCGLGLVTWPWLGVHVSPSKISAVVSISLSQSSSLELSVPSNMVVSYRNDVVRLVYHCGACGVSVYCCIAACMGLSKGLLCRVWMQL